MNEGLARVGRAIVSPLPWFILASIFSGLEKAPVSDHWKSWALCIASILFGIGGILTDPQHLMASIANKIGLKNP